jgi:hypothetical protein
MNATPQPDVWVLLGEAVSTTGPLTGLVSTASDPPPAKRRWQVHLARFRRLLRDVLAVAIWLYLVIQLLVVDVFSVIFRIDSTSGHFVVTHRLIPLAILVLVVSVFYWRWATLGLVLYVIFFPLILAFWKLPKALYAAGVHKNAVAIFAVLNAIALLRKNFRYHLISKSAGLLALALIALPTDHAAIATGAALVLALLAWALARVLSQTFRSGTFVESQRQLISFVARVTDAPIQLSYPARPGISVTKQEADQLANSIQNAAILNRSLYFWAYKLQQYRQTGFVIVFNALSFIGILVGASFAFAMLNFAILRGAPAQFAGTHSPSILAVYLYSLSSIASADGGGITPTGDLAFAVRIVAQFFGPTLVLTVLVSFWLAARATRDDSDLKATIRDLRRRGRDHETRFREVAHVGVDEALGRLIHLGLGNLSTLVAWFQNAVPPDFIDDDDNDSE